MNVGPRAIIASFTRRRLLLLAATALASAFGSSRGRAGPDQGIGGTGASLRRVDQDSDRGIGGTGVIGTIRKFGSIVVNDLRIAYPSDAAVYIDGQPATPSALKIGQVVRVVADSEGTGMSTRTIDVSSEVVGPVERVGAKSLIVLGQTVSTAALKPGQRFALGDHVAISGLRRNNGTIAASLIEPGVPGFFKLVGPIVRSQDGYLRIGGQKVSNAVSDLVGQRAIVIGRPEQGVLSAARSISETAVFPSTVRRLSVEAYVERRGSTLTLGSGQVVEGNATSLPPGRVVRAVLKTEIGADGRLTLHSLQAGGTRYDAAPHGGGDPMTSPGRTNPDAPRGAGPKGGPDAQRGPEGPKAAPDGPRAPPDSPRQPIDAPRAPPPPPMGSPPGGPPAPGSPPGGRGGGRH